MKVLLIGKAPKNDIVINDTYVSDIHLQIIKKDNGECSVVDLDSRNGTYVNGERISGEVILKDDDKICIGTTIIPWKEYVADKTGTSSNIGTKEINIKKEKNNKNPKKRGTKYLIIFLLLVVIASVVYYFLNKKAGTLQIIQVTDTIIVKEPINDTPLLINQDSITDSQDTILGNNNYTAELTDLLYIKALENEASNKDQQFQEAQKQLNDAIKAGDKSTDEINRLRGNVEKIQAEVAEANNKLQAAKAEAEKYKAKAEAEAVAKAAAETKAAEAEAELQKMKEKYKIAEAEEKANKYKSEAENAAKAAEVAALQAIEAADQAIEALEQADQAYKAAEKAIEAMNQADQAADQAHKAADQAHKAAEQAIEAAKQATEAAKQAGTKNAKEAAEKAIEAAEKAQTAAEQSTKGLTALQKAFKILNENKDITNTSTATGASTSTTTGTGAGEYETTISNLTKSAQGQQ